MHPDQWATPSSHRGLGNTAPVRARQLHDCLPPELLDCMTARSDWHASRIAQIQLSLLALQSRLKHVIQSASKNAQPLVSPRTEGLLSRAARRVQFGSISRGENVNGRPAGPNPSERPTSSGHEMRSDDEVPNSGTKENFELVPSGPMVQHYLIVSTARGGGSAGACKVKKPKLAEISVTSFPHCRLLPQ